MSAVIYAAIVVMWAVVLVPMWLRRHDAASESRSVDRFSTAMRTLSRRTSSGPGKRYVVMPRRGESAPTVHVSGAAAAARSPRRSAPVTAPIAPAAAKRVTARSPKSIVARRRRMLLGMAGVAFLTFVLAIAGVLSWPLQAVFDVVVIAFCIHLRAQARRATVLSRTRSAAPAASAAPASRMAAPRMPAAAPAAQSVAAPAAPAASGPATATVDDWDEDDEWGDDTWQPVPV
ncbi:MAG: hypothetical protein JO222_08265, partial [Frankiales bacterium]|nr:hypothetical protein [Frankiales bacterium]